MTNAPIIKYPMTKNVVFVIMAAGEGKRMNSNVPKVLHEHDGVPMLVKIIRTTQELVPKKIIIITLPAY